MPNIQHLEGLSDRDFLRWLADNPGAYKYSFHHLQYIKTRLYWISNNTGVPAVGRF